MGVEEEISPLSSHFLLRRAAMPRLLLKLMRSLRQDVRQFPELRKDGFLVLRLLRFLPVFLFHGPPTFFCDYALLHIMHRPDGLSDIVAMSC